MPSSSTCSPSIWREGLLPARLVFVCRMSSHALTQQMPMDDDVKLMKRSSRHIITGSSNGTVRLLDMNSLATVKQFDHVHTGTILDMDTHDNLLITCGYSLRYLPVHLWGLSLWLADAVQTRKLHCGSASQGI